MASSSIEKKANNSIKGLIGFFEKVDLINKDMEFNGRDYACYLDSNYLVEQLMTIKDVEKKINNFTKAFQLIEDLNKETLKLNNQLKYVEIIENDTPQKFGITLVIKKQTMKSTICFFIHQHTLLLIC